MVNTKNCILLLQSANSSLENAIDSENYKTLKTVDNYIPAGSFAKAVLLSGVDAETGLNSSSDPEPVLIRIIDHGTLPRKFKSDLKDYSGSFRQGSFSGLDK